MIRLILPVPPSTNRWGRVVAGRFILSREARAYKEAADAEFRRMALQPIEGPVMLCAEVFRPRRAGDLDNWSKILLDVLSGWAYRDDSQIVSIHLERFEDPALPRVQVLVSPADQDVPDTWYMLSGKLDAFRRIETATKAAHAMTLARQREKKAAKPNRFDIKSLAKSASYRRGK
jgi:Holliday junction resolvase RusA-like endonuclease